MKRRVLFILFIVVIFSFNTQSILPQAKESSKNTNKEKKSLEQLPDTTSNEPYYRDIYPDTWVGTDALGRTMPDYSEVGPVKKDHRRVVGIFYITWHRDELHNLKSPYTADVTKILATDPKARLDGKNP
ncbi:MAG: hypothetical protein ACYDEE_17300, partial [Ignavibacteriaceae bacterium]